MNTPPGNAWGPRVGPSLSNAQVCAAMKIEAQRLWATVKFLRENRLEPQHSARPSSQSEKLKTHLAYLKGRSHAYSRLVDAILETNQAPISYHEKKHVVYAVLHLGKNSPDLIYVGETKQFRIRQGQHLNAGKHPDNTGLLSGGP